MLIVDDIAETRENVRKLLQFENDIEVVGAARNGKEGIQLSQEANPDVVLMDINMPDMDGIAATEQIRQRSPHIQVIILSIQGDQNYMRRAMLAGARDFLTKPPMGDELISAIKRAGEMAHLEREKGAKQQAFAAAPGAPGAGGFQPAAQGKIIVVYSPKGGTGCTTLAVNLAIALNNEDTRSVLIDGNLQFGDVAIFINEQGKNTILDIAPRVADLDSEMVDEILIKHEASGIRVLAGPQRPEMAEQVTADQFSKVLEFMKRTYSYVVVDTSSTLTDAVLAAFDLCDALVLVGTQEIPAIKSARLVLDLLTSMNISKERVVLALNRFDKRLAITPERVGGNLKHDVAAAIPLDEKVALMAVNRGVPFMLDNKSQPIGRGVLALAEAVRARIIALESAEEEAAKR
ncbi:MAG: response regulator [Anaerolineales bacterium]|nr:response regulator [Anaerolineales bacterium]